MVHLLLMYRGVKMRIESLNGVEHAVAHGTLPIKAVDARPVAKKLTFIFLIPLNLLICDDSVRVMIANHTKDSFAI